MSKSYDKFLKESIDAEALNLINEAMLDEDKMDILEMFLEEEVANTASAPGLAMVSDGEPVSPKYKVKEFGKGIWRRKKKNPNDLMEMALPKKKKATTGHLEHVADYIYHGDPSVTMKHMTAMHQRFKGKTTKGHQPSVKVDGGHSLVVGRDHDGTHFVRSKHGGEQAIFRSEEDIHKTGKEHYVRDLIPVLQHVKKMNIKPGHAFQADLIHHTETKGDTAKPNTITYKKKKGTTLAIAAHSQYKLSKKNAGKMAKTTSHPDVRQLQAGGVHAPDLSINRRTKLSLHPNRDRQITKHLAAAHKYLTPEVHDFSRRLASGEGVHSQMHDMVRNYSNTAARTTGLRSVEGLKAHAKQWVDRTTKSEKGRAKKLAELHGQIDAHAHHLKSMFKAHHHVKQATHHMLDQFRGHEHQFDVPTHAGEEHEGLVSTIGKGKNATQVKLVRQGPKGFPKKNFENPRFAKGQTPMNEMKLSLDIHNTNLMETHYVIHGVETITVDDVMSLIPVEELEMLAEGAKRKIVIRGGKKRIVFKCPEGQKLAKRGGKACIKMGGAEKAKRSRQAKKSARKSKKKRAAANRKRAKSLKKRKSMVR